MLTDSKCLFDVLTSNKNTKEGRLMLDTFAARQAYSRREIDNIGLIKSEVNLADDLTKMNGNGALSRAMQSSRLDHMSKIIFSAATSNAVKLSHRFTRRQYCLHIVAS
eukprot:Plantae.Rhodophyta-Palmaria_palmata.ctg21584.p1 GENE.Plantae.Rhodophyta-Palmaria_palmata.ctg21584~~Plantae.Rhodophyta-Palmaria_palmata.ctg21584.p1  ORF type:complete len:118 (+),score=18.35 Plantae.Rhodophyta-Palmaria_palmata.ctg21584:31-354(+)